jgi:CO/xanthine dehydrogenase FAD-binding subunit
LEDGAIGEVRLAIGAATDTARRLPDTEALLMGVRADDDRGLREAGRAAAAEAPVVADDRGSAAYKRVLIEVHLCRLIQRIVAGGGDE